MSQFRLAHRTVVAAIVWLSLALPRPASGQDPSDYLLQTGAPSFAAVDTFPGNISVNIVNGNMHIEIPLSRYPQRGSLSAGLKLVYDSRVWANCGGGCEGATQSPLDPVVQELPAFGWYIVGPPRIPAAPGGGYCSGGSPNIPECVWTGPDGTSHIFMLGTAKGIAGGAVRDAHALDGSGFHLYLFQPASSFYFTQIYAKDGALVYSDPIDSYLPCSNPSCTFPVRDTNGNFINWSYAGENSAGGSSYPWQATDTLGRQLISGTRSADGSGQLLQFNLPNSQGTTSAIKIQLVSLGCVYPFSETSQICGGETKGYVPWAVLQSIAFADGSQYSFMYDCNPNTSVGGGSPLACSNSNALPNGASLSYGTMTSVTLPTGGTVTFGYTNFTDANGYLNQWLKSLSYGGGTWMYTQATGCGASCQTVTVARPSGDQAVYTFNIAVPSAPWNTQIQYYNGTVGGTPALVVTKAPAQYPICPGPLYPIIAPFPPTSSVTVTVPTPSGNLARQTSFSFDAIQETCTVTTGKLLSASEYGFGVNSPGPLLRTEAVSYLDDSNANYRTSGAIAGYSTFYSGSDGGNITLPNVSAVNIANRVIDQQVLNPSNTVLAETKITYDSPAPASITGVQNHDDANFGPSNTIRGNPTLIQSLLNGSFITAATATYDTTGQVTQIQDANNNATLLGYGDNYFTDASPAANPPAPYAPKNPTNANLTKITPPIIGSATLGYYYGTGKPAASVDQNGADSYQHYLDPLDRLTNTFLPITNGARGWSLLTYASGGTQADFYSAINDTSPSTGCSSCTHTRQNADTFGRPIQRTLVNDPDGPTIVATSYDTSGRVSAAANPYRTTSDPTYGLTTPTYDGLDRTTLLTEADGSTIHTYYGADVTTPGGASVQLCSPATYGYGDPVLQVDEAGNKGQAWTDAFGRTVEVDEPNSSGALTVQTCYTYDQLDNLTGVYQTGGSSNQAQWRVRTYSYDSLSRLTSATEPESGTTTYTYDKNGNLLTNTSPAPNQTGSATVTISYCYDALNRLTAKAYTYSPSTPPTCSGTPPTFPSPVSTFTYDLSTFDGDSYFQNPVGRLISTQQVLAPGIFANTWMDYDAMGRVQHLAQCARYNCGPFGSNPYWWTVTNTYDLAGNLQTYTDAFGNLFTQTNNDAGRPTQLASSWSDSTHPATLLTSATYFPHGALKTASLGNGLTETGAYNTRLQPCRMATNSTGAGPATCSDTHTGDVLDFSYGYNTGADNENVTVWSASGQQTFARSFAYDPLSRLLKMTETSGSVETCKPASSPSTPYTVTWTIDAWGNLLNQNPSSTQQPNNNPGCSISQSVGANNQLAGYLYDAAGNMTSDGTNFYFYDAENRLAEVYPLSFGNLGTTPPNCGSYATVSCYFYNAEGQRISKYQGAGVQTTFYIYDTNGEVVADSDVNLNWNETYIHFGGELIGQYRGSSTGFVIKDHLGSTRLDTVFVPSGGTPPSGCTVPSGTAYCVYDNMDYLPFGEQIAGSSAITHKFTGKERDSESGLDYFGARYYSSQWSRFMSPDPLGGYPGNPQSWNRYSYVQNNPLNYIDPWGLCSAPDNDADDPDVDSGQCTDGGNGNNAGNNITPPPYAPGADASGAVLSYSASGPLGGYDFQAFSAFPFSSEVNSVGNAIWNELWNESRDSYLATGPGSPMFNPLTFYMGTRMDEKTPANSLEKWAMRATFAATFLFGGEDADAARVLARPGTRIHHIATNKALVSGFKAAFESIFEKAGMKLSDPENLMAMRYADHFSSHSFGYHNYVLNTLSRAIEGLSGAEAKAALIQALQLLRKELLENPGMLRMP